MRDSIDSSTRPSSVSTTQPYSVSASSKRTSACAPRSAKRCSRFARAAAKALPMRTNTRSCAPSAESPSFTRPATICGLSEISWAITRRAMIVAGSTINCTGPGSAAAAAFAIGAGAGTEGMRGGSSDARGGRDARSGSSSWRIASTNSLGKGGGLSEGSGSSFFTACRPRADGIQDGTRARGLLTRAKVTLRGASAIASPSLLAPRGVSNHRTLRLEGDGAFSVQAQRHLDDFTLGRFDVGQTNSTHHFHVFLDALGGALGHTGKDVGSEGFRSRLHGHRQFLDRHGLEQRTQGARVEHREILEGVHGAADFRRELLIALFERSEQRFTGLATHAANQRRK